jgi:Tol biopolymer transport system component
MTKTNQDPRFNAPGVLFIPGIGALLSIAFLVPCASADDRVMRVSVDSVGIEGNRISFVGALTGTGSVVVFTSESDNLVKGDTNRVWDAFVHDLGQRITKRFGISWDGQEANGETFAGDLSSIGRMVLFTSGATNLIPFDQNGGVADVFLRDRTAETTTVVSVSSDGAQGDIGSNHPAMSADARYVAFRSRATNLVPDDRNGHGDVFVRDRLLGVTTRVSVNSEGEEGNDDSGRNGVDITPDGRFVVFDSEADNLVPDDTNLARDIFVHDRDLDEDGIFDEPGAIETTRVSIGNGWESDGSSFRATISADGRYVAFDSPNWIVGPDNNYDWDVFLHDRRERFTIIITLGIGFRSGNGASMAPSISGDGSKIAFQSTSSNLIEGDTNETCDIFVYDVATREKERVVMGLGGEEPDGCSNSPTYAAGGCFIGFSSDATNLVEGDTNGVTDAFVLQLCIPGDFDGDERVDQADFVTLEACLTGPGVRPAEACRRADLDVDLDVDLYDFAILQANYTEGE